MGSSIKNENFPWIELHSMEQFERYYQQSTPVLIFKHSTRCHISSSVLRRFEKEYPINSETTALFLDLIKHRDISNEIARKTGVVHQSPQLILLENKMVKYHASHEQIVSY